MCIILLLLSIHTVPQSWSLIFEIYEGDLGGRERTKYCLVFQDRQKDRHTLKTVYHHMPYQSLDGILEPYFGLSASPDARKMVYQKEGFEEVGTINLIHPNEESAKSISTSRCLWLPVSWSPEGDKIIYCWQTVGPDLMAIYDLETESEGAVFNVPGYPEPTEYQVRECPHIYIESSGAFPVFLSEDTIAYVNTYFNEPELGGIYIASFKTKQKKRISKLQIPQSRFISPSPKLYGSYLCALRDSIQLAITTEEGIYIHELSTGKECLWIPGGSDLAISPDYKQIAYVRDGDIYIASRDGSNPVNVTNTPEIEEILPNFVSPDVNIEKLLTVFQDFEE